MPRGAGRPPKLSIVKKTQGNPGKRPLNETEKLTTKKLGYAPQGTPEPERKIWNKVKGQCPWLTAADAMLVQDFCELWILKETARRRLMQLMLNSVRLTRVQLADPDRQDAVIAASAEDDKMIGQLQRTQNAASVQCRHIMVELGMTPLAREDLAKLLGNEQPQGKAGKYLGTG